MAQPVAGELFAAVAALAVDDRARLDLDDAARTAVAAQAQAAKPVNQLQVAAPGLEHKPQFGLFLASPRPLRSRAAIFLEERIQRLDQRCRRLPAKRPFGQLAAAADLPERPLPRGDAVLPAIHRRTLGADQLMLQLPGLQGIECERLDILAHRAIAFKCHLEPLPEECPHRVAQEIGQFAERERLVPFRRRQGFVRDCCGRVGKPFTRVAEQRRIAAGRRKIRTTEGLQRMRDGQRLGQAAAPRALPACGKMVAQLADQHRGRALGVVVDAVAHPRDVQALTGRQQRLEEEIAIILAPRAVAGAIVAPHQVEIQRRPAARVITVVHAQQADDPEGDRAHRHQRREGNRAGKEALRQAAAIERGEPLLRHHRER